MIRWEDNVDWVIREGPEEVIFEVTGRNDKRLSVRHVSTEAASSRMSNHTGKGPEAGRNLGCWHN